MKKISIILFLLFGCVHFVQAQCFCEDCPEPIIFGSPSSATLNVSGITNNILGQNGQSVVNVGVSFTHDAAQELSLRLVAPDGSFVDLTIGEGLDFGDQNIFDIDFIPCSGAPMPDCINNATWTSTDEWNAGPYTGSYYPELGCLEDLTGDVNGTWTLEMEDVFVIEDGELFCFDITFADDAGAVCNMTGCSDQACLAQGGQQMSPLTVQVPEGDPSLIIDFDIEYALCESPAPSPEYTYVWVVYEPFPGPIIDIFEGTVDMTAYPEGTYIVSGLSILTSDLPEILALDFSTTTFSDIFNMLQNGEICADNVSIHSVVEINNCSLTFSGFINFDIIEAEEGDPALDPDWPITWTPAAPDFGIWGLYYVVYDQATGVIIDYLLTDDFTGLEEGNYQVSIMVYLLSDASNIPPIDGILTYSDLGQAIANDELCADLFGFNLLNISEACTAAMDAAGILEQEDITAPEGDSALNPDWDVTFSGGDPDPAEYGFYFVVFDPVTDEIIALLSDDDFTGLPFGNYNVTLLYYDLDDEGVIPTPNGTNTFLDIVNLINNGDLCATYFGLNLLNITLACEADAGTFSVTSYSECEGDGDLILDLTPNYPGAAPDDNLYGYTFVVSENGVIVEIDPSNDFTDFAVGVYEICGLSYLLNDQPLLPIPNGALTITDIQNDIDSEVYCADLTTLCVELEIIEVPEVIFTGPTEVCAGVEVQYVVENFTGNNLDYLFTINQGSFTQFINDENGTLSVIWASGPGNICATEIDGGCEGTTCITIDVVDQIEIEITGFEEVCPGQEVVYVITPIPNGSEFYDISVVGGIITNQTANTVTILWDDNTDPGALTAVLMGAGCETDPEILEVTKIEEVDFPIVNIPEESCINTGLTIPDIDDPDVVDWEWTATNADIFIQAGFVNFTWQNVGLAQICLDITTTCSTDQMCYDVNVLEAPEPFIAPQLEFCSTTFILNASPSIGNSWFWSSPGAGASVSFTDQTNFTTEVTVNGPGTYTFVLQEFSENCIGSVETTVTIVDGLETSDPIVNCDNEGNYTVAFEILSGSAPYTVDGFPISGNLYVSESIPSGSFYFFAIADSEGCTAAVEGAFICPCLTDAGTMSSDPILLCISENESGQGIHNDDAFFDTDDIGQYILHTGDNASLGTIIEINDTGAFMFDEASMVPGQVYFISYVAGNNIGGAVDLTDPCLSVAVGQPIIFYDDPEVDAGQDDTTCGLLYNLSSNAISTGGTWSVLSQPMGSLVELQIISGETWANVDMIGEYEFQLQIVENGCTGVDDVLIEFLENPQALNLSTLCEGDEYTVYFEVSGGTAPFLVNGELLENFEFLSEPIPSGENFGFTIVDAEGCSSTFIQGTEVCNCETDAGTMSDEEITICALEGTPIIADFNNDAIFDGNDTGMFVLHTNASNILGDILDENDVPEFLYSSNYGEGLTLYISYVAGDNLNGSIDFEDECLSIAFGQPVNIQPIVELDAGDYTEECGFSFELMANDQGVAGIWSVVDMPAGANITFDNEADAQSAFETDLPGIYELSWQATNEECAIGDTTQFELFAPLQVDEELLICAEDLSTYEVSVTISGGQEPYLLNGDEVSNEFILPATMSGENYSFTILDSRGCSLILEGSADCSCTNEGGTMSLDTLNGCVTDTLFAVYNNDAIPDMNDRELFVLHTSAADTLGAVIGVFLTPEVVFLPGMMVGQTYYLSHIMANAEGAGIQYTDPCLQLSEGQPIVFYDFPEVYAGEDQEVCGLSTTLEGNAQEDIHFWSVLVSPSGSSIAFDEVDLETEVTVSIPGIYEFLLETSNGFCSETDLVRIEFINSISYEGLEINCSNQGYTVSFNISGGNTPYTVDGMEIAGNTFTSSVIPLGESFSFEIRDQDFCPPLSVEGTDDCDCENDAGTMIAQFFELCEDDVIDLNSLGNNDEVLEDGDIRYHVIHSSPTKELGDILGYIEYVPGIQELVFENFSFDYGVTYYISTVVAAEGALEGLVEDPCIQVAEGVPIVWQQNSEVSFGEDRLACFGSEVVLEINASGPFPFDVRVTDNAGFTEDVSINQQTVSFIYPFNGETTLILEGVSAEQCLTSDKPSIILLPEVLPEAELTEFVRICNTEEFGSNVSLETLISSGFENGRWFYNGEEFIEAINFDGFDPGTYSLQYIIESELCDDQNIYTVDVIVEDCQCTEFDYTAIDVSCFGGSDGSIIILTENNVEIEDFTIELNGDEIESELEITDLDAGFYVLEISDGENCLATFEIEIYEPEAVNISLGEDMEVEINDPVVIEALTNLLNEQIEGITWSSLTGILPDEDLMLNTSFVKDDKISIFIVDENGCEAFDEINVKVDIGEIDIPNVLNPRSVNGNNTIKIYNSEGIDEIKSFQIFDRWGNQIFAVENVPPDSEAATWDGTFKSAPVNPGVYVYRLLIEVQGMEQVIIGDVTVL